MSLQVKINLEFTYLKKAGRKNCSLLPTKQK